MNWVVKNKQEFDYVQIGWSISLDYFGCSQDQTRSEKVSSKIVASDEDSVNQQPNPKITWRMDGAKMVLIPAGNFEMGDHLDGLKVALPVHTVELDAFYMDIYEVTMGQYKKFIKQK